MQLAPLALLLLLLAPAPAGAFNLYVAKNGSDANACTAPDAPCLTIQEAVNRVPGGSLGMRINVARGSYVENISITYFRAMEILGDCDDLGAVEIKTATAAPVLWIQDKAIVIMHCFTIAAGVPGAVGIQARQEPIVDVDRVRFAAFPSGIHISLAERAKLTCMHGPNGEPVIVAGSAVGFANASEQSQLFVHCPIVFEGQIAFTYFTQCAELSLCKYNGLSWTGAKVTGKQFYCDNSDMTLPMGPPPSGFVRSMPGKGFDNVENRCKLRNIEAN